MARYHRSRHRVVRPSDVETHRRHDAALLGYDWAAAIVDDSRGVGSRAFLNDRDEDLSELAAFRRSNPEVCVGAATMEDVENEIRGLGPVDTIRGGSGGGGEGCGDGSGNLSPDHVCIFPYEIEERLFARPKEKDKESSVAVCSICRHPRPSLDIEPALVKVTLSRSHFPVPYVPRPHRRNSFDPTDSLSLASHLLKGSRPRKTADTLPVTKSLALRRNLIVKDDGRQRTKSKHFH